MNKVNGDIIIIGASETSKGVMFHRTGITYAEAKRYDKSLSVDEYNALLGITPIPIKEIGKYEKSEKTVIQNKKYKVKLNNK